MNISQEDMEEYAYHTRNLSTNLATVCIQYMIDHKLTQPGVMLSSLSLSHSALLSELERECGPMTTVRIVDAEVASKLAQDFITKGGGKCFSTKKNIVN